MRDLHGATKIRIISIVDDDESMREAIGMLLRSLDYTVRSFASAEEYLASAHISETDCLITDIQMPGLSGLDLKGRLEKDGWRMPVIFITAYPDESTRSRIIGGGAAGYLTKPFDVERLVSQLEMALAG